MTTNTERRTSHFVLFGCNQFTVNMVRDDVRSFGMSLLAECMAVDVDVLFEPLSVRYVVSTTTDGLSAVIGTVPLL